MCRVKCSQHGERWPHVLFLRVKVVKTDDKVANDTVGHAVWWKRQRRQSWPLDCIHTNRNFPSWCYTSNNLTPPISHLTFVWRGAGHHLQAETFSSLQSFRKLNWSPLFSALWLTNARDLCVFHFGFSLVGEAIWSRCVCVRKCLPHWFSLLQVRSEKNIQNIDKNSISDAWPFFNLTWQIHTWTFCFNPIWIYIMLLFLRLNN